MKPNLYRHHVVLCCLLMAFGSLITISCGTRRFNARPFLTSMFASKNVYKTKDTLTLYKVYDIDKQTAYHNTDTVYRLISPSVYPIKKQKEVHQSVYSFIRYRIVKDGYSSYVKILPSVYFHVPDTLIDRSKKTDQSQVLRNNKDVHHTIAALQAITKDTDTKITVLYISPERDSSPVLNSISVSGNSRADRFYFKLLDSGKLSPAQKYLATEQITGVPVSIPFKLRLARAAGHDQISSNLSLGYAFGFRAKLGNNPYNDNYIRTVVAVGAGTDIYFNASSPDPNTTVTTQTTTTTTTDVPTTDGSKEQVQVQTVSKTSSSSNTAQFTYTVALGATIELGSRLNIGLFYGWDHMVGDHRDWIYQGKPWLGFGFGINFGSIKVAAK